MDANAASLFGIFDPMQEQIRRARYGSQPVFGPGVPTEQPAQAMQAGILGKLDQKLQPFGGLLGVGVNLLSESGRNGSFGGSIGNALLAGQQQTSDNQQNKLRSDYMRAQIEAMQRPQRAGTPQTVIGPDGKPMLTSDWEGKTPYQDPSAGPARPSPLVEWDEFQRMTPAQKQEYLSMKRQPATPQIVTVNGVPTIVDRRTGEARPLSTQEATNAAEAAAAAAKAGGTETGQATAKATVDLPTIETGANYTVKLVRDLKEHPGKKYAVGAASVLPTVPGTSQAGFVARLEQIKGKQFLEAFNSLRGGGQITEVEGAKAEAAIARMQRSQNVKEFDKAADEFIGVVEQGLVNARKKAGGSKPAGAGGSRFSEGQTATNPQTGEKMVYRGGQWVRQ